MPAIIGKGTAVALVLESGTAGPGSRLLPQLTQKAPLPGAGAPQLGQARAKGAPQLAQNFEPAGSSAPHVAHFIESSRPGAGSLH